MGHDEREWIFRLFLPVRSVVFTLLCGLHVWLDVALIQQCSHLLSSIPFLRGPFLPLVDRCWAYVLFFVFGGSPLLAFQGRRVRCRCLMLLACITMLVSWTLPLSSLVRVGAYILLSFRESPPRCSWYVN